MKKKHGDDYLKGRRAKTDRELQRLRIVVEDLEARKAALMDELELRRRARRGS